jgi:hypothetical protein
MVFMFDWILLDNVCCGDNVNNTFISLVGDIVLVHDHWIWVCLRRSPD